jgi:peptidoglycan/LPS O-acetylase OafA/YrhL
MASSKNHARFAALDGWRGVCALLVAVHNFQDFQPRLYDLSFVSHSSIFVDFFFVLSGFVITHASLRQLEKCSVASFMLRRFGRLWPLHVTVLAAFVGRKVLQLIISGLFQLPADITPSNSADSLGSIITNVLLIQIFDKDNALSWNGPSWSISAEFWTYLVYSGIFFFSLKRPPSVFLMGIVAVLAGGVVALLSDSFLESNTDYVMFRCIYGFFVGHVAYRMQEGNISRFRLGSLLEIFLVIFVFAFVCAAGPNLLSMAAPFVFAFAVWVFAEENGLVSKVLVSQPLAYLGAWSYSIYMVHRFVGGTVYLIDKLVVAYARKQSPWLLGLLGEGPFSAAWAADLELAIYLVLVIAISAITYWAVEQPGRRIFNHMSERVCHPHTDAGE